MPLPHSVVLILAGLIVVASVILVVRRVDVRLVLACSGIVLAALAGRPLAALDAFTGTMVNPAFVVPICCSMAFAYTLKLTGCDGHLVRLLVTPIRGLGPLVPPAAVAVPFIVNTAIISQSSTAATVGPVLLPLLLATGLTPTMAGVALLIGASVGGELLNAGAPEIAAIANAAGQSIPDVLRRMLPLALTAGGAATLVYWYGLRRPDGVTTNDPRQQVPTNVELGGGLPANLRQSAPMGGTDEAPVDEPINLLKAAIPLVPILLLLLDARLHLFPRPEGWKEWMPIGYAMLIGSGLAMLTKPRSVSEAAAAFFQGQGFAYANIISLIVAALTFVEGLKQSGLMKLATDSLSQIPALAVPAAVIVPGSLALLTGSGIAPSLTFIEAFLPHAPTWQVDSVGLGIVAAQAAAIGRTFSPAAAVVMVCSALSGAPPLALLRRAAAPLITAWVVTLLMGFWLAR